MFAFAVWGSLGASLVLGMFMLVQAVMEKEKRRAYAIFSLAWFVLAGLDASATWLGDSYEPLRVLWCGLYISSLLHLFRYPRVTVFAAGMLVPVTGFIAYAVDHSELATTFSFVFVFLLAGLTHLAHYLRHSGYASAILCAYLVAMALHCAFYVPVVVSSGNATLMAIGYAQYAVLAIFSVVMGWLHLPRELGGRFPVKVEYRLALIHFVSVLSGICLVNWGLLHLGGDSWLIHCLWWGNALMMGSTFWLYFVNRHRLIIHTDNVEQLLENRTRSLSDARRDLARLNHLQADKLKEQESELKRRNEVISRQKRLELAAQTAGGIAHDIQNIVGALEHHVLRLELPHQSEEPGPGEGRMQSIKQQVKNLYNLNQQLLSLSRRGNMKTELLEVKDVVCATLDCLPEGQLVVREGGSGIHIRASCSQLSRALLNLCMNALEAQDGRGPVELDYGAVEIREIRQCHLGFLLPGSYAFIRVSDNGKGIPDQVLEHIFDPFFSTKSSSRSGASGTGLGLAIVNAVVEDHKGVLDVDSGPDGSRFCMYLPREIAGSPEKGGVAHFDTAVVAICASSDLLLAVKNLADRGVHCRSYESGTEALNHLQKDKPRVLVLEDDASAANTLYCAINLCPELQTVLCRSPGVTGFSTLSTDAVLYRPIDSETLLDTVLHLKKGKA